MPGSFFDTNVLLYLVSDDDAKATLAETALGDGGMASVQVLNEIANVARRKMRFSWEKTHELLDMLSAILTVQPLPIGTHSFGLALAERYQLSVFDSMIVASALEAECERLYSEDLQNGMIFNQRLRVINPFADQSSVAYRRPNSRSISASFSSI